jgi:hypothetical protein
MVSFETNQVIFLVSLYKLVEYTLRIWTSINVVSDKDLDGMGCRSIPDIVLDFGEQVFQEVSTPVYIANGIDADIVRDTRPMRPFWA